METIRFNIADVCSKWGFSDGNMLDDLILDVADEHGIDYKGINKHLILFEVMKQYVFPKIKNKLDIVFISTNHNPIKARTLDGIEVDWYETDWYDKSGIALKPEEILIEKQNVLKIINQMLCV